MAGYAIVAGTHRMAEEAAARWGLSDYTLIIDVDETEAQLIAMPD